MNHEKKTEYRRPPIVVVMGHIDHGKTTLLDWYRKTKVTETESGGITQHVGAYEVEHNGRRITFIDTPGHEAFSKIRSRGANIADCAVLVVAAEEGVKPQTKEAIGTIREHHLPFVVAINKIDKPEANPERVKQELAQEEVQVESYGGKIPSVEISAKKGTRMDDLLETILLLSDLEDLSADPDKPAEGVVVEAHLDSRRGISATILILDGSIKKGDYMAIGRSVEAAKILEDFRGKPIEQAGPSSPIRLAGLGETPSVGEQFRVFPSKQATHNYIKNLPPEEKTEIKNIIPEESERPIFNIILKADVVGSKEALEETLGKLESDNVGVRMIRSEIGDIGESDVKLALATKLVTIVGFRVKIDASVRDLAEKSGVKIVTGQTIYDIFDQTREKMKDVIPPIVARVELGRARILKLFKKEGNIQILGGRIEDGLLKKGSALEIIRVKAVLGNGTIVELQKDKRQVDSAERGSEFGVKIDAKIALQEGDTIVAFEEQKIPRI